MSATIHALTEVSSDLAAISKCAKFVKERIAGMKAAVAWIDCGRKLSELKKGLIRPSGPMGHIRRGDNERVGWKRALQLGEFPFGRAHAQNLIKMSEFFQGQQLSTLKKLPASIGSLLILSRKFSLEQVEKCIADGSISPGTIEKDVRELALRLKLMPPRKSKKKSPPISFDNARAAYFLEAPKQFNSTEEKKEELFQLMSALGIKIGDFIMAEIRFSDGRRK
jgi:hypothetical protein